MSYRPERMPITANSKCTGNSHCELCHDCKRRSTLRKDDSFLLFAPGDGKRCPAVK